MRLKSFATDWRPLSAAIAILALVACGAESPTATPAPATRSPAAQAPLPLTPRVGGPLQLATPGVAIDTAREYLAVFKTEVGEFKVELYAEQVPTTVNNFVYLARNGYYDNSTFHRVLEGFMAQGGDPTGTGAGSPGWVIRDEFDPGLRHDGPGVISMANSGPDSGGSQFFITFGATPWLDDRHAVFGKVVEGMEVVKNIRLRDPSTEPNAPPGTKITAIEIIEQ